MSDDKDTLLTVKAFADRFQMKEQSVYEAIRNDRLAFEVVRVTTGTRGTIRIRVPKRAA